MRHPFNKPSTTGRASFASSAFSQKNAFIFNAPDSLYFKAAKQLSDMFEKSLEKFEVEAESVNPLQLDTMERCRLLLADMAANPLAEWFLEPVDHVGLGLTDYMQVISQPMDLSTAGKKLERNEYMSPEDFSHDVRLVFQNAIAYNSAASMCAATCLPRASAFRGRPVLAIIPHLLPSAASSCFPQVRGRRRHPRHCLRPSVRAVDSGSCIGSGPAHPGPTRLAYVCAKEEVL